MRRPLSAGLATLTPMLVPMLAGAQNQSSPIVTTPLPLLAPTVQYPPPAPATGQPQAVQPPQGQVPQPQQYPQSQYQQPQYQQPQYQPPQYPQSQYQLPQFQQPQYAQPQNQPPQFQQPQYPQPQGQQPQYPQPQNQQPQSQQPRGQPSPGQPPQAGQPSQGQAAPGAPPQVQQPSAAAPSPGQPSAQDQGQPASPEQTVPPPPNPWLPQGTAVLQALDKVNAQATTLTVKVGQTTTFGSLSIAVRACVVRPPNMPQDASAYLTITDSHPDQPGFKGWMLKSAPSLSMLEHPLYDVRVMGCAP
jgi:hypothetical protein